MVHLDLRLSLFQYHLRFINPESVEKLSSLNKSLMLRFLKETCYQNRRHASPLSFSGSLRQRCSNANRSSSQSGVYNYKPSCLSNCLSVSLLSGGWGKTGRLGGAGDEWCHTIDIVQSPDYRLRKQWVRVKRRKVKVWQSVTWSARWVSGLTQWPCSGASAGSSTWRVQQWLQGSW